MKRVLLITILLLSVAGASAREVVSINRGWRFFGENESNSDNARIVNLPHTWNTDALSGQDDYFRGVGNYMKDIQVPEGWRFKRTYIRFGGAATVATVMVNGRLVGEHKGGYTAFCFDITPFLNYGARNSIWVKVSNSPVMDVLPTAGNMNVYGGLHREVELILTDASHISVTDYASEGVYLYQRRVSRERAEVDAIIKVDAPRDRTLTLSLIVTNPRKDTIYQQSTRYRSPAQGNGSITIPFVLERPTLWNGVDNPYLYSVNVKVADEQRLCDSVTVPMGLRFFAIDPHEGFSLNGHAYPIQGVVYHEDRASTGTALASYEVEEDVDLMTDMGVTAVRAAPAPHHADFYNLCDRKGILVWSDLPFVGPAYLTDQGYVNTQGFHDNAIVQLQEMIAQRFNNPSVIIWGLFSQQNTQGDNPIPFIKELNELAREDNARMTGGVSNQDGPINFITDLVMWDHVLGWKEGQPEDIALWVNQLNTQWGSLCSALSYGAGASIYHQEDTLHRPNYLSNWHPERWQSHLHEVYYRHTHNARGIWGVFVANMFDFGAAKNMWGDGRGIDDRGLVTFDRKYRKDAFYFYKANWNLTDPFVQFAEQRWVRRSSRVQNLKVYSNATEVELLVNGTSKGKRNGVNGIFLWEGVELSNGTNTLEARSDSGIDYTTVIIDQNQSLHGIY